jgi:CRP/FNR family cyclic AMP-dependent transcriptional regulator
MTNECREVDLSEFDFAKDLHPTAREKLMRIAKVDHFLAGETVFREGQIYGRVHWVISGRVTLEMSTGAMAPKCVLSVGKGDLLAWSSLVGNQCMTASAIATTDTSLISFDAVELLNLCETDRELGYRLMRRVAISLSKRLLATRLQLLDLFGHPHEANP